MSYNLDKEEKELLEAYDRGEFGSVMSEEELERFREYAQYTLKKTRRINLRISEGDLIAIKMAAMREGIPYQTLITSLIRKYVTGRLKEVD